MHLTPQGSGSVSLLARTGLGSSPGIQAQVQFFDNESYTGYFSDMQNVSCKQAGTGVGVGVSLTSRFQSIDDGSSPEIQTQVHLPSVALYTRCCSGMQ